MLSTFVMINILADAGAIWTLIQYKDVALLV